MASPRAGNSLTLTVRRGTVLNQVLKQPSGRQTPLLARQRGGGGAGDWDTVLQSDRAGAADNAEDFTREFMSQLMGNTGANIPPPAANNKTPLREGFKNSSSIDEWNRPIIFTPPTHQCLSGLLVD